MKYRTFQSIMISMFFSGMANLELDWKISWQISPLSIQQMNQRDLFKNIISTNQKSFFMIPDFASRLVDILSLGWKDPLVKSWP